MISMLTRVLSPVGVNLGEVQKIRREIKEILEREDIDLVLCNGKPFESFEAVLPLIKINKDIKFIAYQTDDFVTAEDERYFPKIFLIRRNIQRKKRINK